MENSGFGGPVWSRYVETSKEEKIDYVPKSAQTLVGAGVVEAARLNVYHLGVLMEKV